MKTYIVVARLSSGKLFDVELSRACIVEAIETVLRMKSVDKVLFASIGHEHI